MKWLTYHSQGQPQMRPGNKTVCMTESVYILARVWLHAFSMSVN